MLDVHRSHDSGRPLKGFVLHIATIESFGANDITTNSYLATAADAVARVVLTKPLDADLLTRAVASALAGTRIN